MPKVFCCCCFCFTFSLIIIKFICYVCIFPFVHSFYAPINRNRRFFFMIFVNEPLTQNHLIVFFFSFSSLLLPLCCFFLSSFGHNTYQTTTVKQKKKHIQMCKWRWRSNGSFLKVLFVTETGNHPQLNFESQLRKKKQICSSFITEFYTLNNNKKTIWILKKELWFRWISRRTNEKKGHFE